MSDNRSKVPLGQSLSLLAKSKSADALQSLGQRLPCTVSKVISSGIVEVNFEVNGGVFTLPKLTVPIANAEYIRFPIQKGDKGYCQAADVRLGAMTGLGGGTPDLSRPTNLQGLSFVWLGNSAWTAALDPNAVEAYGVGVSGVIIRSGDSATVITVRGDGVTIKLGGPLNIQTNGNNVNVTGGGDVIVNGISSQHHTHSGVTTGAGDSGPPV